MRSERRVNVLTIKIAEMDKRYFSIAAHARVECLLFITRWYLNVKKKKKNGPVRWCWEQTFVGAVL